MLGKKLLVLFFLSLGLCWVSAQGVPDDVQGKLLLKVISFDKNMARLGNPIKIGVSSDKMLAAMKALSAIQINGKSFTVAKLASAADVGKFNVVHVGEESAGLIPKVAAAAKASKTLTFSGTKSGVEKGLAVGFFVSEGKPKIVISPAAAATVGSDFMENFLKVSLVIGEL